MSKSDYKKVVKHSMKNEFVEAKDVKIGDNVWEHNLVTSIKEVRMHDNSDEYLLFNGESITPWVARWNTKVIVTNR